MIEPARVLSLQITNFRAYRAKGRRYGFLMSTLTFVIALVVMVGWKIDSAELKSVLPGFVTMKFNTAFALLLFAAAQMILSLKPHRKFKAAAQALVVLAMSIGIATLAEYISGISFGIDEYFFKDPDVVSLLYPPGRPAPVTALSFCLLGLGIWFARFVRPAKFRLSQALLFVAIIISFQALLGYVLGIQTSFGVEAHTRIALHTAACLIFLGVSALSLNLFRGYVRVLSLPDAAGAAVRRLLGAAVLFPPIMNWLGRFGEKDSLYRQNFATLTNICGGIIFFVLILWWNSEKLQSSERKRKVAARALQKHEAEKIRLISEQKLINAVRNSEAHFKAVFESASSGIICMNPGGKILDWNPKAQEIFGWSKKEVIGKDILYMIAPEEFWHSYRIELWAPFKEKVESVSHPPIELKALRKNGEVFPLQVTVRPIDLEQDFSFTIFIEDISERRRDEKVLIETRQQALDANRIKSEFLANMSHEIRTPLNGIVGMTKLLSKTPLNSKQIDFVETIQVSSNTLLTLVNQILDLSKIESGSLQLEEAHFELRSLIRSTLSIIEFTAKTKGLSIMTEIGPDVTDFFIGDPLRLRQVLLNLLNNAVKFTAAGQITLRVHQSIEIESRCNLKFEVIDQGIGIKSEKKTKMFRAFSQGDGSTSRKYGGTGLGLVISKQLVELMGGGIDFESTEGVGSRFFFEIAVVISQIGEVQELQSTEEKPSKKISGHFLIAEDNPINQRVIFELVKLLGCTSEITANGREAIETLKTKALDLVLMDGQMPHMDGYEATQLIRRGGAGANNVDIPIIATTANAIKGDIEKCFEAGMNDYISKPISFENFSHKIELWMERGRLVILPEAITKLRELGQIGSRDIVTELIHIFKKETPEKIVEMRTRLDENQFLEISKAAHYIKSNCGTLGIFRMKDLSERIEQQAKTDANSKDLGLLISLLEKECATAILELDKYLIPEKQRIRA